MIVSASRAAVRRGDTLPDQTRRWIDETIGLIYGTHHRVWHPNPRYMEPGQDIGHWTTEERKR